MNQLAANESAIEPFSFQVKRTSDIVDMYLQFFEELDRNNLWLVGPVEMKPCGAYSIFTATVLNRAVN